MKETVFVDTNVLLDVLLGRRPFLAASQAVWTLAEQKQIKAVVSATSFQNVYYVVRRLASKQNAEAAVRGLRSVFTVAAVDSETIDQAIIAGLSDFEDAIQYVCAQRAGAACIITRDENHFRGTTIPALAPDVFLANLKSS